MASQPMSVKSTKETTNYARLCRLLIEVGGQALRDKFNDFVKPEILERVLKNVKPQLEGLKKKRILNPLQWNCLYPLRSSTVSSKNFDITTLCVLLTNICNGVTQFKSCPDDTDLSLGADIFRIRHIRNAVYAHVTKAAIDDVDFSKHWSDIRDVILRIGGASYKATIEEVGTVCMDPELADFQKELFKQWRKDDDNIMEKLDKLDEKVTDLEDQVAVIEKNCTKELAEVKKGLLYLFVEITGTKYSNPRREDLSKEDEIERQITSEVREQFCSNMEGKDTTHDLQRHLQSLGLKVKAAEDGSLKITVECRTLEVLQCLWEEYTSGRLNTIAESCFLTDDMKRRYNVTSVSLKTTILEEDYLACKNLLVAHENQQSSTNKGEYLSQVQTETAFTPDIPAAEKVGSGASGLNYEDNLEHMQAARRSCQEEETQEMESGKLSQADSVKKPIREVHQNGQPPVKVVQVSGEEGEKKMRITLKCPDLNSLQSLWEDYRSGSLNAAAARCLLTDNIKEKFGVESISVETTILEKDYLACREYLSENIGEKKMIKEEREQEEKKEEVKKRDSEESKIVEDKERIIEGEKGENEGKNEEESRKNREEERKKEEEERKEDRRKMEESEKEGEAWRKEEEERKEDERKKEESEKEDEKWRKEEEERKEDERKNEESEKESEEWRKVEEERIKIVEKRKEENEELRRGEEEREKEMKDGKSVIRMDSALQGVGRSIEDSFSIQDPTGQVSSTGFEREERDSFLKQGSPSSPGGQPRNLPCVTTHFVGRDANVDEIIKKLKTSRVVVILAIPGMGKTEVGVRVSQLLEEEGHQFVTHIRVESRHRKLEDVCSEILCRLSGRTWSQTADFVSIAKRKLSERNIPTVIVLDNTENIQGKEFDEFTQWLVKSAPNVKLLITTRKDVGFVSADVCKFLLKPLDPNSSAELLRTLVDGCSKEHSEELAKLCGGMPLLLTTCSDLINNGFSPEGFIHYLRNNPIQLMKTSANDFYNTLQVFFTTFPDEVKKNLVLLSVFPSEFSAKEIQFLFEDRLHCETVKNTMVNYALLQRDADGKMRMHPLVQAYFRTEKESLGMGNLWHAAQRKFNHHYLDLLRVLSREFISRDSALVAIHKFRQQKANIMEALKNCLEDSSDSDDKNLVLDVLNSTEVLNFVAKVLTPSKECTMLYQKCYDIAKASGDKKKHAESLYSLGFRRLCDVSHSEDSPEGNIVTFEKFLEAYDMHTTLPKEYQRSEAHAHTASKLGVCLVLQGDKKEGRKLIQEGISIRESLSDRLYIADGYCDLGNSYRLCGDHQKAIDIWKENTLPVYKEQLGNHPWTASILSYIADSYKTLAVGSSEQGYIDQAESYFREALGLRKKLLGDHQDTARSHVQLSDVLVLQGQFGEALKKLNKAFIIQNDILGPEHRITRNTVEKQSDLREILRSNPR